VDKDEDRVEAAIKDGMLAVYADASRDDVLREVGIERAKGLIATLSSDADNLFVILTARTPQSEKWNWPRASWTRPANRSAPRRREFRFCAVRQHRPSHGAGAVAAARPPVHGFHHARSECRHRTGARGQRGDMADQSVADMVRREPA
jgi:voltage-gated potassium channel Kch